MLLATWEPCSLRKHRSHWNRASNAGLILKDGKQNSESHYLTQKNFATLCQLYCIYFEDYYIFIVAFLDVLKKDFREHFQVEETEDLNLCLLLCWSHKNHSCCWGRQQCSPQVSVLAERHHDQQVAENCHDNDEREKDGESDGLQGAQEFLLLLLVRLLFFRVFYVIQQTAREK